jgi:hypothetical protein
VAGHGHGRLTRKTIGRPTDTTTLRRTFRSRKTQGRPLARTVLAMVTLAPDDRLLPAGVGPGARLRHPEALDAYAAATDFCQQQGIEGMAEICFACLAPVMVKTGEWDRAVELCRAILDGGDAPALARMVAAAELGIVSVLRGETRRTRRLLSDSFAFARRNELFGLEVEAAHGLARADALGGRVDDALHRARDLIGRIADREERHYSVPALRWSTTFFARQGLKADVARSAELLLEGRLRAAGFSNVNT